MINNKKEKINELENKIKDLERELRELIEYYKLKELKEKITNL